VLVVCMYPELLNGVETWSTQRIESGWMGEFEA
jgi:hypothetical protein